MSETSSHYGFKEFCLDPSYPGSCFFKPTVLVFEGYGRVFSKIEPESDLFCEIVERVVIFAIASIALIFALLIAALGLIVKSLGYSCCDPRVIRDLKQPPDAQQENEAEIHGAHAKVEKDEEILGSQQTFSPPPSSMALIHPALPENPKSDVLEITQKEKELIDRALGYLGNVKKELQKISLRDVHIKRVEELLDEVQRNKDVSQALTCSPTNKNDSKKSPYDPVIDAYELVLSLIDFLRRTYYYSNALTNRKGGIEDNGDCLFETFFRCLEIDRLYVLPDLSEQNQLNIQWLECERKTNPQVQFLLVRALSDKKGIDFASYQECEHLIPTFFEEIKITAESKGFKHWIDVYAFCSRFDLSGICFKAGNYEKPCYSVKGQQHTMFFKLDYGFYIPYASHDLRLEAVEWISKNYKTDKTLIGLLVESMAGHYLSLMEREPKLAEICEAILLLLFKARGDKGEEMSYGPIEKLIPGYLEEMVKPTIFGGPAEAYALCKIYDVSLEVHVKTANGVLVQKINENGKKKKYAFNLENKHYSPNLD